MRNQRCGAFSVAGRLAVLASIGILFICAAGCNATPKAATVLRPSNPVVEIRVRNAHGARPRGEVWVQVNGRAIGTTLNGSCRIAMPVGRCKVVLRSTNTNTIVRAYESFDLAAGQRRVLVATSTRRWWAKPEAGEMLAARLAARARM